MKKPRFSISVRLRFIECYIWSTLLYGWWDETWIISKKLQQRLEAFEMWTHRAGCWEKAELGVWPINRFLVKQAWKGRCLTPFDTVREGKLSFLGNGMEHDVLQRNISDVIEGKTEGRRIKDSLKRCLFSCCATKMTQQRCLCWHRATKVAENL